MENSTPQKNNRLVVILLAVIVVLLAAVLGMFVLKGEDKSEETPKLTYAAEGITATKDVNALQAAVNEAYAKTNQKSLTVSYQRTATSSDGQNFKCYIGNAKVNLLDLYIGLYADPEYTDQLYLSGLIRPGEAFESITLDRKLPPGNHDVYVAYTQVEEDLETIHGQAFVQMEFVVQ